MSCARQKSRNCLNKRIQTAADPFDRLESSELPPPAFRMSALEEKKARRAADREARRQAAETADGTAEAPEVRDTPPPLAALRAHLTSTLPSHAQAEVKDKRIAHVEGKLRAADQKVRVVCMTCVEICVTCVAICVA